MCAPTPGAAGSPKVCLCMAAASTPQIEGPAGAGDGSWVWPLTRTLVCIIYVTFPPRNCPRAHGWECVYGGVGVCVYAPSGLVRLLRRVPYNFINHNMLATGRRAMSMCPLQCGQQRLRLRFRAHFITSECQTVAIKCMCVCEWGVVV